MNGKRTVSLLTAASILASLCTASFAADKTYKALDAAENGGGASKTSQGYVIESPYCYVGFSDVDLTGIKTVAITAKVDMSQADGDMIQVRIDDPVKGDFLGYVEINGHDPDNAKVFKGSITETSGKHKVYLVSSTAYAKSSVITEVSFLTETYEKEKYVPLSDDVIVDTHASTWAMTDALGRKVADYEEVGPLKAGRQVGMFYWTWPRGERGSDHKPVNMSEFSAQHPEIKYDYNSDIWPKNASYYWNEPLFGYYSGTDYWIYRKHAEMLANAGVDTIVFDATNDAKTFRRQSDVLFAAFYDAKKDGLNVPKFCFMTPFGKTNGAAKQNIMRLYFSAYYGGKYSDLWFKWEGKPLLIGWQDMLKPRDNDPVDAALMQEIKDFFTWRSCQPNYDEGQNSENQWAWLEIYPQHGFTKNEDGSYEMVPVAVAANYSEQLRDKIAMNDKHVMGRSYTSRYGQDKSAGAYKYGYFFTEQVNHALTIDAELMFIDGWNEWTAARLPYWQNVVNASGDTYDNEASRDIEPTKGDMGDNYYALLVDAVRKWKGAEPVPAAGEDKTIDLNDVSSWDSVTPVYYNNKGTYNRNSESYGIKYENSTARNNVIRAKVSKDAENLYFLAECAANITEQTGKDWMKLYIDTDRNRPTGWEGYDYVINSPVAGDISRLSADGTAEKIGTAEFKVSGEKLSVKVPRAILGLSGELNFEFKWVDNASGDILNLYVDGNSAPMGRFNYVYTQKAQKALSDDLRKQLTGITVLKDGSNRVIMSGGKAFAYDKNTIYGARRINGVMYFPAELLYDALGYKVEWDGGRNMLKLFHDDFLYTVAGTGEARVNGVLKAVTNPVTVIDGIPYIPVTLLKENLGIEVYDSGSLSAFGTGINGAVIDSLVNEF